MARVVYKAIAGFDGTYRVGTDGTVWSQLPVNGKGCKCTGKWHQLIPNVLGNGYLQVSLQRADGVVIYRKVHQLVLESFVGPRPRGYVARHVLNNDQSDCRLENLAWGTTKENANDKRRHGTHICGNQIKRAVLTDEIVRQSRRRARNGEAVKSIASSLHCSYLALLTAVSGKTWRHVQEPPVTSFCRPQLDVGTVRQVKTLLRRGVGGRQIALRFGISEGVISTIKTGRRYASV